jgi:hypothetical protein
MTAAQELTQKLAQRNFEVSALLDLWRAVVSGPCPAEQQFHVWLRRHSFQTVVFAIQETGSKQTRRGGAMNSDHVVRFASRVMNEADPDHAAAVQQQAKAAA